MNMENRFVRRADAAHGACALNPFLRTLFVVSFFGLWSALPARAVPASPDGLEVTQPDGSVFRLHVRGDEYFCWTETAEGYAVLKDTADGFWKYARPAAGQPVFQIVAGTRVGSTDPRASGLTKRALPEPGVLRDTLRMRRRALKAQPVPLPVPAQTTVEVLQTPDPEAPPVQPPSPISVSGTKTIRNIVLLACFSNHWNAAASTVSSSYGRVAVSEYTNLFNQVGHTADGAVGSVRDYYSEVSYGKLTVESVVFKWVLLPKSEAYYGADGIYLDANWEEMISDAINAADSAGLDFSQGDSDGDGWVDCLTVIHSGHGQEVTGNPSTCIWSKQGEMVSLVTKDGVRLNRCHTEPALRGSAASSTSIIRIGVICHEMGHFFGLSDLYDYSDTTYGVGDWGLMGFGSWNGSSGNRPAHFCAHSKYMLGFVKPVMAHSQAGVAVPRVEDNPVVLMLRDGMSNGEYFLIENRAKTGFDNDAAIYPGMLVYHVDSKSSDNDLGTWAHPLVKIEEADGDDSIGGQTAYSEAGDVWTSTSGLAGGFRDQTGNQSANAMMYQAAFYNRSDNSAYYSYLRVTNFSAASSSMSCDIQSLRTTVGSQTVYSSGYTVSWAPCSQTAYYELQEGARATLTSFSDGAESEDALYENWHLSGTVRRSSAGMRSGSYSYLLQVFDGIDWYSPVQSLTLRKPFKVSSGTVVSFYLKSHLHDDGGYLMCEVSKDNGSTWITLNTYNGYINTWTLSSFNYAALNASGINVGDTCIIRFVMNAEQAYGWSSFPDYGFALDDISVTGTEIDGYGGWTTLASTVSTSSFAVPSRTNGVYAYRVRAYANSTWQAYGVEGEVSVILPYVTLSLAGSPMAEAGATAVLTATLSQAAPLPVVVGLSFSGTATATNDFTVTAPVITIAAGNLSGTLPITAVQDLLYETNETIVVEVSSVLNGEESGPQQVVATILDDDPPPGSFWEWAQNYCPGMDLPTAFTNDYNSDGVKNGFDYAFGLNLETNAPLLNIFSLTNQPVVDIPLQLASTLPYVGIQIEMKSDLSQPAWNTNGLHAIDAAGEPTNRSWYVPDAVGTSGFFRLRGLLKE